MQLLYVRRCRCVGTPICRLVSLSLIMSNYDVMKLLFRKVLLLLLLLLLSLPIRSLGHQAGSCLWLVVADSGDHRLQLTSRLRLGQVKRTWPA